MKFNEFFAKIFFVMIVGIGVDIIEICRIKKAIGRWGDRFLNRVFTTGEITYCQKRKCAEQHFAARFSAKEAALKALGIGKSLGTRWREMEIIRNHRGKPSLILSGKVLIIARRLKISGIHLSLSHSDNYAIAQVVLEK